MAINTLPEIWPLARYRLTSPHYMPRTPGAFPEPLAADTEVESDRAPSSAMIGLDAQADANIAVLRQYRKDQRDAASRMAEGIAAITDLAAASKNAPLPGVAPYVGGQTETPEQIEARVRAQLDAEYRAKYGEQPAAPPLPEPTKADKKGKSVAPAPPAPLPPPSAS